MSAARRRSLYRMVLLITLVAIGVPLSLAEDSAAPSPSSDEYCEPIGPVVVGMPIPEKFDEKLVASVVASAEFQGSVDQGVHTFRSAKFACVSCHEIGGSGGKIGPNLSDVGKRLTTQQIVEAVFWPDRTVHADFQTWLVQISDGQVLKGYKREAEPGEIMLFDPATQVTHNLPEDDIEDQRATGTLMPVGLANSMSDSERRDLIYFLSGLGKNEQWLARYQNFDQPTEFVYERAPLDRDAWSLWQEPVNRDRIYDFYRKEAEHFRVQANVPHLLPAYPGLDGGNQGHWGNQKEATWRDGRWSEQDKTPVLAGVTHLPDGTVKKGICLQLGDQGELSTCFNPETLKYEAIWRGGFVKFSAVRHGFMDGLRPDGELQTLPKQESPSQPFEYHGYYRVGPRVVFAYRIGDTEYLDSPWVDANGEFQRDLKVPNEHPLAKATQNPPTQWPDQLVTEGELGEGDAAYVVDTIKLPFENPYGSLMFVSGHDFLADGTAVLSTMTGDVWLVSGLDSTLKEVRWKRFAAGLHQPLGVVVWKDHIYVLGRDQITRLVDLNGDQEADFYECFSNVFATSPGGHDYTCGLTRDDEGNFYTASGKQGVIRISADGKKVDVLATGFRNPDGIGLCDDGKLTVPCSEGDWTPASMICLVDPSLPVPAHFGYPGPRYGQPPALPLAYLPRGLDNSSGGQTMVNDARFGPLNGQIIHTSFGAGAYFQVLRDEVNGQAQGAVVPLPGNFRSGAHRAKVNPADGQLYVSGMAGWGSYTPDDGCFHRVRYTGKPMQTLVGFHVHENGVMLEFSQRINGEHIGHLARQFAQVWNYRYGPGYGSPELAPGHPGVVGHESLRITAVHWIDNKTLFVEMPELQPVNQLHLVLEVDRGPLQELFITVHQLDAPFTDIAGYRPTGKVIAAHPMASDLALLGDKPTNPWLEKPEGGKLQELAIAAGPNLTFSTKTLKAKAGEPIKLTFSNPDVVPHNWVLLKPGTLETVGDLANKFVANPSAVLKQYVPESPDVLTYTDIVPPTKEFFIYFQAPTEPGRYPYLCTFPGHWMVMNGELIVE
ncbi:DUF6797 domain-containing protein [Bremerella sp. JC817]|uniref:DUF6797 domain-containing protein n=1 Tax=Bremerella sp. JC817 TaxID=3231756 RepID=UPI00345A2355